jgi:uncharacterized protein (TIGR00255 family)
MISSMTGYGRGEKSGGQVGFVVEIKSVNHRFCDITVKQPRELLQFEDRLKDLVKSYAVRGKIDVFVNQLPGGELGATVVADEGLIKAYVDAFARLNEALGTGVELDARTLTTIPGALTVTPVKLDPEEIWKVLAEAAKAAAEDFTAMRKREGEKLAEALTETGKTLAAMLETVRERAPEIPAQYKAKLEERIAELGQKSVDPQRIAAEVAIFADRCSIDEEIARLDSHLGQLFSLVNSDGAVGKQLDFLVQEMNREVNTMGSKANDLALTQTVLNMKNEVEKLREQIQNVE